jgi:integrase
LTDLIDTWIQNKLEAEELSQHGAKLYRAYLRRLLKGMNLTPEQLLTKAKADINQVWTDAKNTGGMTAAGRHKALLAFKNFLRSNGFYPPADRLKQGRRARTMGHMTWDEALAISNAAAKPYNLIFRLMLHSAWGAGEFLEFNKAETWKRVRQSLAKNPNAEYYRFNFSGRKSNDQPFYSLVPATVLREIFASEITLPISTIKGLPLDHSRYNRAIIYLESAFNTALKRAPIPPSQTKVTLHELRDCFRTRCTLWKVPYEVAEFCMGHVLDQRGYEKCFYDEPWMWAELRKIYGPAVATETQLQQRDEVIKGLQSQIDDLKAGRGFSEADVAKMIEAYLAKR